MYSIRAFAELAGVTIKALRHYETLGLLVPTRSRAHYRRYSRADLWRLERILALKSLALPLRAVDALLARGRVDLSTHREALEQKRERLTRTIEALATLEAEQRPTQALRRFVAEAAWERWEERRRTRASTAPRAPDRAATSRVALFRAIESALTADPAGLRARTLAARWRDLVDTETREALRKRGNWPTGMRRYVASLYETTPENWERVIGFIETRSRG